jgi:sugar phosphate isomerase/epimerase
MLINLDTGMIGLGKKPLNTLIPLAVKYGYGTVQFPLWEISTVKQAKEATLRLTDEGVDWGLMPMDIDLLRECPDAVFKADFEQVKQQMELAQAAGVRGYYNHVWPGSNERAYDDNFAWHIDRITKVHQEAKNHGIKYSLEFLGPKPLHDSFSHPFIRKLSDGLPLADAVSKEIGVVVDTFHWYTSGSTLEDLALIGSGERIVNVHLNDGWKGRTPDEQQDMERELPLATGVIDCVSVVRALDELGYKGVVSVEPFEPAGSRLRALPLEEALQVVADSVKEVFAQAGIA